MATATTEQQMLDVLMINNDSMMGVTEKLSHFDIGFNPGGDRRVIVGVELGERMESVVRRAAESFLMTDEITIEAASLPEEIKSASRKISHFTDGYYARHITDADGTDAWAVFYVRMLDTEVRVA